MKEITCFKDLQDWDWEKYIKDMINEIIAELAARYIAEKVCEKLLKQLTVDIE